MTKSEARAILAFRTAVNRELAKVLSRLEPRNRQYAEAYWHTEIHNTVNGLGFGTMPVGQAEDVLEELL